VAVGTRSIPCVVAKATGIPTFQRFVPGSDFAGVLMGKKATMERPRTSDRETLDRTGIRIVWRERAFRLECAGRTDVLQLSVYQGEVLLAAEQVPSAEMAFQRGRELCDALERSRAREYGKSG
jgi:hypothetical protein